MDAMVSCDGPAHIGRTERLRAPDPLAAEGDPSAAPSRRAVAPAAGGLDPQPLAGAERPRGLRLDLGVPDEVASHRAVPAAVGARWRVTAPLGQQRVRHVLERLDLADDAVAAAALAVAAGVASHRVLDHSQRELEL